MASPNPFLTAALSYAARGWRVVPLMAKDKRPWVKDWVNAASVDPAQLGKWWSDKPASNVGVALGEASGLVAIDVDTQAGMERLLAMSEGDFPATCELTTGKGSRFLFSIPKGLTRSPETRSIKGADGQEDLRFQASGGQCVLPPSIHPNGKTYLWVEGRSPEDLEPAPMPAWLVEEMCKPERADMHEPAAVGTWDAGGDFSRRGDWWSEILEPAGFKKAGQSAGGVQRFTRPGKDGGVSVTLGHYKAKDGTPALYVFSGSIAELPPGKCFDKFGAYTRLFHGGNFKLAAEMLARKGYGVQRAVVGKPGKPQTTETNAAQTEQWPEPIPLPEAGSVPSFPLDVYPIPIQMFLETLAKATNTPPGYGGTYMLGISAGLIGATFDIEVGDEWVEPCVLWCLIVAGKSSGKSPVLKAIMRVVRKMNSERKALGQPTLSTRRCTTEGMRAFLAKHPRGFLYANDEVTGWVQGMNQYKSGGRGADRADWLGTYDGTADGAILKGDPDASSGVSYPRVSVVGGIQTSILGDLRIGGDGQERDDGFVERPSYSFERKLRRRRYRRDIAVHKDEWWAIARRLADLKMVKDAMDLRDGEERPHLLRLSDEAKVVFDDWTEELANLCNDPDEDPNLEGGRAKMAGTVARYAMVLHILQAQAKGVGEPNRSQPVPTQVEGDTVRNAIRLGRYFLAHAAKVMGAEAAAPTEAAKRILQWVTRRKESERYLPFSRRDVHRALIRQFPKADMLSPLLKLLVQHGWLRYADAIGRQKEANYEPHPQLTELMLSTSVNDVSTKDVDSKKRDTARV